MNSARSDKERMLDYARPGKIVEVGPGGVVLDLLEQHLSGSEIIGIDASHLAIEALVPGRRLVIRDGAMPPPGTRILRFCIPELNPTSPRRPATRPTRGRCLSGLPGRRNLRAGCQLCFGARQRSRSC